MKNDRLEAYPTMSRRAALSAVAAAMGSVAFATETPQRSRLGLVAYNCAIRRKWLQQRDPKFDLFEPLTFLKHCRDVGAGGMQTSLGVLDAARVKSLRDFTAILKRAKPDIRMLLELITRDPLKVPCLTDSYWATMPSVVGSDLARTLRFVREHPAKTLQEVGSWSLEKQVELEDANISASLKFAREVLAM